MARTPSQQRRRLVLLLLCSPLRSAAQHTPSSAQPHNTQHTHKKPRFAQRLSVFSIKNAATKLNRNDWNEITQGNKIVLPNSFLHQLQQKSIPITQFQILNPAQKNIKIYTGPLDFCAPDGECYLPAWLMKQLDLAEGSLLSIATANFPSGTYASFQPHSSDFLDVPNHYYLLMKTLDHFAALTAGSTIRVTDGKRIYYLDVLEVRAKAGAAVARDESKGRAIDLTMVELSVDFQPPKDQQLPSDKSVANAGDAEEGSMGEMVHSRSNMDFSSSGLEGKKVSKKSANKRDSAMSGVPAAKFRRKTASGERATGTKSDFAVKGKVIGGIDELEEETKVAPATEMTAEAAATMQPIVTLLRSMLALVRVFVRMFTKLLVPTRVSLAV